MCHKTKSELARLKFEHAYYYVAGQHVNHNVTSIPQDENNGVKKKMLSHRENLSSCKDRKDFGVDSFGAK